MIQYKGYSTLEVLEGAENYNNWIASSLNVNVTHPILEVGAGIGNISKYFVNTGKLYLTEIDEGMLSLLKKRFNKHTNVTIDKLDITKNPPKKYQSFFSSIIAVNVLEHIKDDDTALKMLNNMLRNKGELRILVPAKKFAYTRLDKELGHYRRYEKEELRAKLKRAGFKIKKLYYFNIVGLGSWIVRDKVEQKHIHLQAKHIALFDSIVPLLRLLERFIPIPFGISLIAIVEK